MEKIRHGKGTSLGAASGVVAGLVAITPACGALSPVGAIVLGLVAGAACALAVGLKYRFGYDDALDVVGVHLVGGIVGTIGVGFLSTSTGLFYGGGAAQLVVQVPWCPSPCSGRAPRRSSWPASSRWSIGLRVDEEDEIEGIDFAEHGESAYEIGPGSASSHGHGRRRRSGAARRA